MNTGQTMLTIGAMALLSIIIMRYYQTIGQSGQTLAQSNAGLTATTIATSFIERAQNTAFDEQSIGTALNLIQANHSLLTAPSALGADSPQERMIIDSVDDFDDFKYWNSTNPITFIPENVNETYHVEFNVYYVDTSDVAAPVNYQTFVKKMDVKVYRVGESAISAAYDTIRLSTIYGLFKYNN
jgi:hypothetical protein